MSYRVQREKKLRHDAENNTAFASVGSKMLLIIVYTVWKDRVFLDFNVGTS